MRVLQVVTLVSGSGAFGGPTRVAFNQARALIDLGHEVEILSTTDDLAPGSRDLDGVPVHLFRRRRFAPGNPFVYATSAAMLRWLGRHAAEFDVVHLHLARDATMVPAALVVRRRGIPYVVQSHGMILPKQSLAHRALDRVATLRLLAGAQRLLALNPPEVEALTALTGSAATITTLPNGTPLPERTATGPVDRTRFLYLARLHPTKRAPLFVQAVTDLLDEGLDVEAVLVGPDEGDGTVVRDQIAALETARPHLAGRISWAGPVPPQDTAAAMASATAYVLPSIEDPFPMSVLEALAHGLPVVISRSNRLHTLVEQYDCGAVVPDDSRSDLVAAMRALAIDPDATRRTGERARLAAEKELGMDAIARRLAQIYLDARNDTGSYRKAGSVA